MASDIIHTIVQPRLVEAVILVLIVGIRVALNYYVTKDIERYEAIIPKAIRNISVDAALSLSKQPISKLSLVFAFQHNDRKGWQC